MSDFAPMTLTDLAIHIRRINVKNGWDVLQMEDWPGLGNRPGENDADGARRIVALLALVHTEASEATEAVRRPDYLNFGEELADIIIRTLDIAAGLQVPIAEAVARKLEENKQRGERHGGKQI